MRPLALALVVLLSASSSAHAVLVTGRAMGTITSNDSSPRAPIAPGDTVSVTFTYDPARAGSSFVIPTGRRYFDIQPWTFSLTTGGGFRGGAVSDRTSPGFASVVDGPTDIFELELSFHGFTGITLTFTDPTGTALSSTALPTLEELLRFPGGTLGFGREAPPDVYFGATVVPVADFPVPEPSTLALGLIGVGVLGLARHKVRLSCKV
jgi:hypothetical protein